MKCYRSLFHAWRPAQQRFKSELEALRVRRTRQILDLGAPLPPPNSTSSGTTPSEVAPTCEGRAPAAPPSPAPISIARDFTSRGEAVLVPSPDGCPDGNRDSRPKPPGRTAHAAALEMCVLKAPKTESIDERRPAPRTEITDQQSTKATTAMMTEAEAARQVTQYKPGARITVAGQTYTLHRLLFSNKNSVVWTATEATSQVHI